MICFHGMIMSSKHREGLKFDAIYLHLLLVFAKFKLIMLMILWASHYYSSPMMSYKDRNHFLSVQQRYLALETSIETLHKSADCMGLKNSFWL